MCTASSGCTAIHQVGSTSSSLWSKETEAQRALVLCQQTSHTVTVRSKAGKWSCRALTHSRTQGLNSPPPSLGRLLRQWTAPYGLEELSSFASNRVGGGAHPPTLTVGSNTTESQDDSSLHRTIFSMKKYVNESLNCKGEGQGMTATLLISLSPVTNVRDWKQLRFRLLGLATAWKIEGETITCLWQHKCLSAGPSLFRDPRRFSLSPRLCWL